MCEVLVAQSCWILWNPMDCSPPSSSVHGILQATIPEWVAILFSRGSSQTRDQSQVSCIAGRFLTVRATREAWLPLNHSLIEFWQLLLDYRLGIYVWIKLWKSGMQVEESRPLCSFKVEQVEMNVYFFLVKLMPISQNSNFTEKVPITPLQRNHINTFMYVLSDSFPIYVY